MMPDLHLTSTNGKGGRMEETNKVSNFRKATLAGGCFWCMVAPFENMPGVIGVVSGYTGGHTGNPTYAQVCSGETGHFEAVQITFDPEKVSYEQLLDVFWRQTDPTDAGGQFHDRGPTYRTAIFYHDEEQSRLAQASKLKVVESLRFAVPVATVILPAGTFYPAEEYHQDFHKKSPDHYKRYRTGSGRDAFINTVWGD